MWVTRTALVYDYVEQNAETKLGDHVFARHMRPGQTEASRRRHVIRVEFEGATGGRGAPAEGERETETRLNYFIGNDPSRHASGVPVYRSAIVPEVYPGVSLRVDAGFGSAQVRFESDGTEPLAAISLRFVGADQDSSHTAIPFGPRTLPTIRTWDGTELVAVYGAESIQETGPEFPATPAIVSNAQGGLPFATFIGASGGNVVATAVAFDSLDRIYVAGSTDALDFPVTHGAYDGTYGGYDSDAFVLRLASDGSALDYATFLGGSVGEDESVYGLYVDEHDKIIVAGNTDSPDFPITEGVFDQSFNGGGEGFVSRLSFDGSSLDFSTFLGGDSYEFISSAVIDDMGRIIVAGRTQSSNFPVSDNAFDKSFGGDYDGFVIRISENGSSIDYSSFVGGVGNDYVSDIEVDVFGRIMIAGTTGSLDFPTTINALDRTLGGATDAFVTRISTEGNSLDYSTLIGGGEYDSIVSIDSDEVGHAYVVGRTISVDFPVTPQAFDQTFEGFSDEFVVKLSINGEALEYSTLFGFDNSESISGLEVDGEGRAIITGETQSLDFQTTENAFDRTIGGSRSAFISRISAAGDELDYSTFISGDVEDNGGSSPLAIVLDGSHVLMVGRAEPDFPTTPGAFMEDPVPGPTNSFVARLSLMGSPAASASLVVSVDQPVRAPGETVRVTVTGATADGSVEVAWAGVLDGIETVQAGTSGAATVWIPIPATTPSGILSVTATDQVTNATSAPVRLQIVRPEPVTAPDPLEPYPYSVGGEPRVKVYWFDPRPRTAANPIEGTRQQHRFRVTPSYDGGATFASSEAKTVEEDSQVGQGKLFDAVFTPTGSIENLLYEIVDLYDTRRVALTPTVTPFDDGTCGATVTLEWDPGWARDKPLSFLPNQDRFERPLGVAADGVARVLVRVEPDGGQSISGATAAVSAFDAIGEPFLGRLREATRIGSFSTEGSDSGMGLSATSTTLHQGAYWFWYRAPDEFAATSSHRGERRRSVTLSVTPTGGTGTCEVKVDIARPPLMLAHGWTGSDKTWDDFAHPVGASGRAPYRRSSLFDVVVRPTYLSGRSVRTSAGTFNGPWGHFADALGEMRQRGFAASQVDYIGHSMGGMVARAAIGTGGVGMDGSSHWLSMNYREGYINRLITLDTPHNGSGWADLLTRLSIPGLNGWFQSVGRPIAMFTDILDEGSFASNLIAHDWKKSAPFTAAQGLSDLQRSGGIGLPTTMGVPSHFIAGDLVPGVQGLSDPGSSIPAELVSSFTVPRGLSTLIDGIRWGSRAAGNRVLDESLKMFDDDAFGIWASINIASASEVGEALVSDGDGVVGVESQLAGNARTTPGVISSGSTLINEVTHAVVGRKVTSDDEVEDVVWELLHSPVTSSVFRTTIPATPAAAPSSALRIAANRLESALNDPPTVEITSPIHRAAIGRPEFIEVTVSIPDTTGIEGLDVSFAEQEISLLQPAPVSRLRFAVPASAADSLSVIAVAYFTREGEPALGGDAIRVYAPRSDSPIALDGDVDVRNTEVGDSWIPTYDALYSDGLVSVNALSGPIQVTVEGTSVQYDAETGRLSAVEPGEAAVYTTYQGARDTSYVYVAESSFTPPVPESGVAVALQAALQGAYDPGTQGMTADLAADGVLVLDQPFGAPSYAGTTVGYEGSEVAAEYLATEGYAADWVLVELRAESSGGAVARMPALILRDGSVVSADGSQALQFDVAPSQYFVVIRHRNHLPVMSSSPVDISSGSASYDFTSSMSQAYSQGGAPMVGLGEGGTAPFAMWAGDGDLDGRVLASDYQTVWRTLTGQEGYLQGDFDLDGRVLASDYQDVWRVVSGVAESQVPEPAASSSATESAQPQEMDGKASVSPRTVRVGRSPVASQPPAVAEERDPVKDHDID